MLTLYAAALLCVMVALFSLRQPPRTSYIAAGALAGAALLAGWRLAKIDMDSETPKT